MIFKRLADLLLLLANGARLLAHLLHFIAETPGRLFFEILLHFFQFPLGAGG